MSPIKHIFPPSPCAHVGLCRHCAHGSSSSSSNSTSSSSPSCPTPLSTCGHPPSPRASRASPTYLHTHPHSHSSPTPARQSPSRKVDNAPRSIHRTPQVMYAPWVAPFMPSAFSPHAPLSLHWHPTALSFHIEGQQDSAPATGAALAGGSHPHTHVLGHCSGNIEQIAGCLSVSEECFGRHDLSCSPFVLLVVSLLSLRLTSRALRSRSHPFQYLSHLVHAPCPFRP